MRSSHILTLAVVASLMITPITALETAAAVGDTQTRYLTNFNQSHTIKKKVKSKAPLKIAAEQQAQPKKKKVSAAQLQVSRKTKISKEEVRQMVIEEALAQGVPVNFALAVARTESNFTCTARSHANALGVMQIKHATARGEGYKGTAAGLFDCRTGIKWGMVYLKRAISISNGDLCHAAHLYYSGVFAKKMTKQGRNYCGVVMKHKKTASSG